jgi:hypothetical protein
LDHEGAAQIFFAGKNGKPYWVKWAGEASVPLETPPLVLGDQSFGIPAVLAVDELGWTTAVWAGDEATRFSVPMYTNARMDEMWSTPKAQGNFTYTSDHQYIPYFSTSNVYGWFVAPIVFMNDSPKGSYTGEIQTYIGQSSTLLHPPALKLTGPLLEPDFEIDSDGNAMMLAAVGSGGDEEHVYWSRFSQATKAWTQPARITPKPAQLLDLLIEPSGRCHAFWFQQTEGKANKVGRLWTSIYQDQDSRWTDAEAITPELTLEFLGWAGANSAGKLAVAWTQQTARADGSTGKDVFYIQFVPSLGWSKPASALSYDGDLGLEAVTVAEQGGVMLLYTSAPLGSSVYDLMWIAGK